MKRTLAHAMTIAFASLPMLTACGGTQVTRPVPFNTQTVVLKGVPAALTATKPIPDGPLAQCPLVARERKRDLEACYADKDAIRLRHGEGDTQ